MQLADDADNDQCRHAQPLGKILANEQIGTLGQLRQQPQSTSPSHESALAGILQRLATMLACAK